MNTRSLRQILKMMSRAFVKLESETMNASSLTKRIVCCKFSFISKIFSTFLKLIWVTVCLKNLWDRLELIHFSVYQKTYLCLSSSIKTLMLLKVAYSIAITLKWSSIWILRRDLNCLNVIMISFFVFTFLRSTRFVVETVIFSNSLSAVSYQISLYLLLVVDDVRLAWWFVNVIVIIAISKRNWKASLSLLTSFKRARRFLKDIEVIRIIELDLVMTL